MLTEHLQKKGTNKVDPVLNFESINSLKSSPVSIKDSVNLGSVCVSEGGVAP